MCWVKGCSVGGARTYSIYDIYIQYIWPYDWHIDNLVKPVVECDLIVCITSLKSGQHSFVRILATIDFTVLRVIGLSLWIMVTGPTYCREREKERSVSESFKSHCPVTLSWPLTFILTVIDRNRKRAHSFSPLNFTTKCHAYLCIFQSSSISNCLLRRPLPF